MHLGIDFDNTLVNYDDLFYRCARDRDWVPAYLPRTKAAVRAWLWSRPGGNTPWTELQGEVYGRRMGEAEPFPGAFACLAACRRRGRRVSIISHKLEWPALGPRVNLRDAARAWMEARGLFAADGPALDPADVWFEGSRAEKLARIAERRCTHYVDDLAEVLLDAAFPPAAERLLFDPAGAAPAPGAGIRVCRTWAEIERYLCEPA